MQQIVAQLTHQGDPAIRAGALSVWPDVRIANREEVLSVLKEQKHRRFMKTHLPRDALKWDPNAKYIFVARDGRDMIWSAHHHLRSYTPEFYEMLNTGDFDGPKCERPSEDPRELFLTLLGPEGGPSQFWPYWSHTRDWWAAKDHPNLLLVHYNDLTADLQGEMRRIAKFLDIPELTQEQWDAAVKHSTFGWMKANAEVPAPPIASVAFDGGARTFINKGTNSRWKDKLSDEDLRAYDARAKQELGEECAHWLEHGRLGSKQPTSM